MAEWKESSTIEEWNQILAASAEKPVFVMKHSTACPISANAWRAFQSHVTNNPHENAEYVMVKVIESRPVSNQIAEDLHVAHQSPQVLLVQNREALWHTSHWDIT